MIFFFSFSVFMVKINFLKNGKFNNLSLFNYEFILVFFFVVLVIFFFLFLILFLLFLVLLFIGYLNNDGFEDVVLEVIVLMYFWMMFSFFVKGSSFL